MCWNRIVAAVAELVCNKNTLPRMRTLCRVHIERCDGWWWWWWADCAVDACLLLCPNEKWCICHLNSSVYLIFILMSSRCYWALPIRTCVRCGMVNSRLMRCPERFTLLLFLYCCLTAIESGQVILYLPTYPSTQLGETSSSSVFHVCLTIMKNFN